MIANSLSLKNLTIGASVFLLLAVFGWMMVRDYFQRAHHPSDRSLVANFHNHRAGFDKLVTMASEDHEIRTIYTDQLMLADSRIWPKECEKCFSWERWAKYKKVFVSLGDAPFCVSKKSNMVLIAMSYSSTEPDPEYITSEKGYAYSVKEPRGLVESLNGMGFETEGTFYKRMDGNWYLYHEWGLGKPE